VKCIQENDIAYCVLATDGNNYGILNLFLVCLRNFDWKMVEFSLLIEFKNKPHGTSDAIATGYINETLEKMEVSEKCMSFTGDNCNAMFGVLRRNEQCGCEVKKRQANRTLA